MIHKTLAFAALIGLAAMPALAQTTTPAPAAAPQPGMAPAPATPASDLTKDRKPRMKVVRAQCREEMKTGGLTGDAKRTAMADCIVKQRPDMEAKVKCQMDPAMKGMDKDAKRDAIKACVAKTKM